MIQEKTQEQRKKEAMLVVLRAEKKLLDMAFANNPNSDVKLAVAEELVAKDARIAVLEREVGQ